MHFFQIDTQPERGISDLPKPFRKKDLLKGLQFRQCACPDAFDSFREKKLPAGAGGILQLPFFEGQGKPVFCLDSSAFFHLLLLLPRAVRRSSLCCKV